MSKLKVLAILSIVFFLGLYYVVFIASQNVNVPESKEEDKPISVSAPLEDTEEAPPVEISESDREKTAAEFPDTTSEGRVQIAIHHMSHSKVHANRKWGHLEPTPARIERLLEVVEINRDSYERDDLYYRILNRWKDGDFSNAVEDHNAIWNLQNGTVGKATRLLTEREQQRYARKHFK